MVVGIVSRQIFLDFYYNYNRQRLYFANRLFAVNYCCIVLNGVARFDVVKLCHLHQSVSFDKAIYSSNVNSC